MNMRHDLQRGTALVFSLLLLLILTLLGISSMNNTLMQERMAANARMQTSVFEASSAGVSNAIDFVFEEANWDPVPDPKVCGTVGEGTQWGPTPWVQVDQDGPIVLEQRMYCLEHPETPDLLPSQLFVLSRGSLREAEEIRAFREIEVRVGRRQPGEFPPPPIMGRGPINSVQAANSNSLFVDGECGPAVLTSTPEDRDLFRAAVGEDRIGNYEGGIHDGEVGAPWDDPETISAFVDSIVPTLGTPAGPNASGVAYTGESSYSFTGQGNAGGSFGDRPEVDDNGDFIPGTGNPQITYFDGNVSMGGNVTGAGIMIVDGTLEWAGTPAFDGLILVLGGSFEISGGGQGGDFGGSLIVTNLTGDPPQFGDLDFAWSGGGNQLFRAQCAALQDFADRLLTTDPQRQQARDMWETNCDCSTISAGDPELMITSWRENIGWRDDAFFGSDG